MKGRLLLNVVVGQSATVLQLLAREDETLLIGRDAFLILNLGLDILNGITGFNLQSDGLASEGLDKDLHATAETEDKMEGGLLLDVVIRESPAIFQLLASKDKTLLIGRDALLILDLGLDIFNRVTGLNLQGDGLASEGLDENLHASSQPKHQVQSGLLLDVVIRKSSAVLKLFSCKDQPLLIRGNALLVLDLGFDVLNGIAWLHFKSDGFPGEGLDKDLHATAETKDKMKGGLLLDVVVGKGPAILKLLASKDETLLIRRNAFLVLNLGLDIFNGIAGLNLQSDGLSSEGLDKDLHATSQAEDKMESGLLLDVVVREGPSILKLLASEDETLLIRRNAFLVLNLGLDVLDGVTGLNLQSDGLASEGLDKNLHATSQAKHQVQGGLLLDVVVGESPAIF